MRNKLVCGIFSSIFLLATAHSAKAQPLRDYIEPKGWSLGITVGGSDLWGDVGTKSPIDHYANLNYGDYANVMGGLYTRYTFHPAFVVRMGINYGTVSAGDAMNSDGAKKASDYSADAVQRYARNLDVKTTIWEGNLWFEINPLRFNPGSKMALRRWQPYFLTGITAFHFRPKGKYVSKTSSAASGQWIDLYDLHLEGDGFAEPGMPKKYSLWQMAIPLGIGSKWDLSSKIAIGIEYIYRYTFTDYLDGVSQKYIDPALYDKYLSPQQAQIAKDMADKSWVLDPTVKHNPGEMRGSNHGPDGYSTLSITLFYKFKSRAIPWWE
jgi:hypothetical protein